MGVTGWVGCGGVGRGGESRWQGDRGAGCNVRRNVAGAVAAAAAVHLQIYSSQLLPHRGGGRPHYKHGELESSCGSGDGERREDGRESRGWVAEVYPCCFCLRLH
jgi:hypothetical protein